MKNKYKKVQFKDLKDPENQATLKQLENDIQIENDIQKEHDFLQSCAYNTSIVLIIMIVIVFIFSIICFILYANNLNKCHNENCTKNTSFIISRKNDHIEMEHKLYNRVTELNHIVYVSKCYLNINKCKLMYYDELLNKNNTLILDIYGLRSCSTQCILIEDIIILY